MSFKLSANLLPLLQKSSEGILTANVKINTFDVVTILLQDGVSKDVKINVLGEEAPNNGSVKGIATFTDDGVISAIAWEPPSITTSTSTTSRKSGLNIVCRKQR